MEKLSLTEMSIISVTNVIQRRNLSPPQGNEPQIYLIILLEILKGDL